MFNLGLIELLLIFFFLVIFIKPEEIPHILKNVGLLYRKLSRYFFNFKFELSKFDTELENPKKKSSKNKKLIILIILEN